jgi:heme/copper-type cytochrome/quinol oxidase subunit 1
MRRAQRISSPVSYDIWPHLTGRALDNFGLMRAQLWTWFIGMILLTFPWHWVGILGMPRRMAFYDYTDPAIAPQALSVILSVIGAISSSSISKRGRAPARSWPRSLPISATRT